MKATLTSSCRHMSAIMQLASAKGAQGAGEADVNDGGKGAVTCLTPRHLRQASEMLQHTDGMSDFADDEPKS